MAGSDNPGDDSLGPALFVQISKPTSGSNKDANPDVTATPSQTVDVVNGMPEQPALIIHTGDITHLSKPAGSIWRQQMLARLRTTELHTVRVSTTPPMPPSRNISAAQRASGNKGYYSFDHAGVHFIALINVLQFKPGEYQGTLGAELAWVAASLKARSSSTPIVVFAHMPLWTIYEPWGWGTDDAPRLMDQLRR